MSSEKRVDSFDNFMKKTFKYKIHAEIDTDIANKFLSRA